MSHVEILQKTPLNETHRSYGAKMVEFGGWDMPLQFTKVLEEHHAVRQAVGLFDISHMGLLSVTSGNVQTSLEAVNYLVPQDLTTLYPGKAVYTQLLNFEGGTIDDIIVYYAPKTEHFQTFCEILIVCNAANTTKVLGWLQKHLPPLFQVSWCNTQYSLIALQGPQFQSSLTAAGLASTAVLPKRFHLGEYLLDETPVMLSRTGYTGEDGVEIIVASTDVVALWKTFITTGASLGLKPVGLAARDTLRLEAAYPLHGAELSETITPLEAGLGWSVKLNQPTDFIGKAALMIQQDNHLGRQFVCIDVLKKSIPRHHDLLYDKEGIPIGEITSGSISPTLDKPIGVGYVRPGITVTPGTPVSVSIRGQLVDAIIVERPFYRS